MSVPAHDAQRGLWFTERALGPNPAHHLAFAVWLDADAAATPGGEGVDVEALMAACRHVAVRHPALRCAVTERDGVPWLRDTLDDTAVDVEQAPLTLGDLERPLRQPFDLSTGPLVRFRVLTRSPGHLLLLVVGHHLVLDGASKDLVLADLAAGYAAARAGTPPVRSPLPFDTLRVDPPDELAVAAAREYWARAGHGPGDVVLPGRHGPAGQPGGDPAPGDDASAWRVLDPGPADRIREAAAGWGGTTYEALVAALHAVLVRYGSPDPVLTLPLSTRPGGDPAGTAVGLRVNEVPFRPPAVTGGVAGHARAVRAALRELYRHRHVPLSRAVSGLPPTQAWTPVVLGYRRRAAVPAFPGATATVQWVVPTGSSRAALELQIVDGGPGTPLDVLVRHRLGSDVGARVWGHVLELLEAAIDAPQAPVAALRLLPPGERAASLAAATGPRRPGHGARTVLELVARRGAERPDAVAVVDGERTWTYRELLDAVAIAAGELARRGVRGGDRVIVELPRSAGALVTLLAVMSRGAAYVPVDPAHPASRRDVIFEDAAARLVVQGRPAGADGRPVPTVAVDELLHPALPPGEVPGAAAPGPGDVAYVMYTSGSTGRPKGVAVGHAALANLLLAVAELLGSTPDDRWLQLTTLSFDISGLELYLPLVTGGSLVVASSVSGADGAGVLRLIASAQVTHVQATPSQWRVLLDAGLRTAGPARLVALAGGEALPPPTAAELRARVSALFNVYGPTETTIWSTADEVLPQAGPDGGCPIGRPLANTRTYVVDGRLALTPDGVPGELAIAGDGVADGYLHRPGLTAARFVPDPYGPPGTRMYLTGDRCLRLPDGRLQYLGRGDGQVKIRGHRVELGEIETRLLGHPRVGDVAVVVRGEGVGQQLVACVVAAPAAGADGGALVPTVAELRAHVAATLPAVMVPTSWELADALPHTPNDKIDRSALAAGPLPGFRPLPAAPEPEQEQEQEPAAVLVEPVVSLERVAVDEAAPVARVTTALQDIWSEVLQVPGVGIDEDLFDLGAHSLTIARLTSRILQQFGVEVPLDTFFDTPTIREIAAVVVAGGEVATCSA